MTDDADLTWTRTLLQEFDLGPLPELDFDEVVRRGHRARRIRVTEQLVAAAAAVAVVAVVGVAAIHGNEHRSAPPVTTVSATPVASTPGELLVAARSAAATATSVHFVGTQGGMTLDVVVTQAGAVGTLAAPSLGTTSSYLYVDGVAYLKGDPPPGLITDSQAAAAKGKWIRIPQFGAFGQGMTLSSLIASVGSNVPTLPTIGESRTVNGTATRALVFSTGQKMYVATSAPYFPYLLSVPATSDSSGSTLGSGATMTDWNAPAPKLPAPPPPTEVFDPTSG
jgi:hypothetical protein